MIKEPILILLAEDDQDDYILFRDALSTVPQQTQLKVVNDGVDLMDFFSDRTGPLPDILFLDLNMPRKNGFECLSEIKLNPKLSEMQVVIFSTSYNSIGVAYLLDQGADFYMRKPKSYARLCLLLQESLNTIVINSISPSPKNFLLNVV
jgi:CheY-like chemotaxis protein